MLRLIVFEFLIFEFLDVNFEGGDDEDEWI